MSTILSHRHADCQTCRAKLICPRCTEDLDNTVKYEMKSLKHVACSLASPLATVAIFLVLLSGPFFINIRTCTCTPVCISPKDCYATGRGLKVAVAGKRTSAVLYMVDDRGDAYTGEVETIACEVINESTGETAECVAKKTRENEYEVSYQPTNRGRHQLHIKVEGEHIKGSPFTVTVKLPVQKLGTPIKTVSGLNQPWGVAVNQRGEVMVAERYGYHISIFSHTGEKLRSFGSKGSGRGQFDEPRGVTADSDDNILVTDSNHCIQKFSSEYQRLTSVRYCSSDHLTMIFGGPFSVNVSPISKKIVVTDWSNHRVLIFNPNLTFHSTIGSEGSGNEQFDHPYDVAFDSAGNLYVSDSFNDRIQVFNQKGRFLRQFGRKGKGIGELNNPTGICTDRNDTVYVAEGGNHRVSIFTWNGRFLRSFGSEGSGPGQFVEPLGITVDKNGIIYVSDSGNNRIQMFKKYQV